MPRKAAATAKIYQIHEIPAAWALVLAGDDDAYDDDFCTPTGVLVHHQDAASIWDDYGPSVMGSMDSGKRVSVPRTNNLRAFGAARSLGRTVASLIAMGIDAAEGDTAGLLWDADAGTLTVLFNGQRRGIAKSKK